MNAAMQSRRPMPACAVLSAWTETSADVVPGVRQPRFELRFTELFNTGHCVVFPCDARGNVDIDHLTERARANYFYARTTIGREYRAPVLCRVADGS